MNPLRARVCDCSHDGECHGGDDCALFVDEDESDLELGEKACIWLAIAVGVAAFVGLVGWMLPPLVRVVRGWLS